MATNPDLLSKAIIPLIKADPVFASMAGARFYDEPPTDPIWPFGRYGAPIQTPTEASGWTGDTQRVALHFFAKGPGKANINRLCSAGARSLDGKDLTLGVDPDTGKSAQVIELEHVQTQVIPDGDEADAFHGIVEFDVTVAQAR